jgi:hypothetical protein
MKKGGIRTDLFVFPLFCAIIFHLLLYDVNAVLYKNRI